MATTAVRDERYVLGHSEEEQRRLDAQGAAIRPLTERLLREAGIGPGMRVLDAGCGTGDVTLLLAELVGPTGTVVAVDRAPEALATARGRAEARGLRRVELVEGDLATLAWSEPFDAVVGRLVLMYQPDPAVVLRRLAAAARRGGVLAFLEIAMVAGLPWPDRPLFDQTYRRVIDAFVAAGAHPDMGIRLPAAFVNAGLPRPHVRLDGILVEGADATWLGQLAGVARALLPAMERHGIATAEQVGIDSLFDRLLAEAERVGNAVAGPTYGAAWVRTGAGDDREGTMNGVVSRPSLQRSQPVDDVRFDRLARRFAVPTDRRAALGGLLALAGALGLAPEAAAKKRKKRKRRPPCPCPPGLECCGGNCFGPCDPGQRRNPVTCQCPDCNLAGRACTNDGQCCSGICDGNICRDADCKQPGESCAIDPETGSSRRCCAGNCINSGGNLVCG